MADERSVVVIGSGPSGAMAARTLLAQGLPVVMLESGTAPPAGLLVRAAGRNIYRRRVEPASAPEQFVVGGDPETTWLSNLALGGLSNQWTGAIPRFVPADFADGERLHECYRWPLDYDGLVPYYERAERVLELTGSATDVPALPAGATRYQRSLPDAWQRIAETARSHGQGLTVLPLADGPRWLVRRCATAFNSYANIVRPLLRSPHFSLTTGAHVLQLEWSGAKRRVTSVVYHDRGTGTTRRQPAAAVVVACGALHSTKLMFDSACPDFPDGLGNTDGLLGAFFHDHPKEWWCVETDRPLPMLSPAGYLTRRPYAESPPLLATSWTIGLATSLDRVRSLAPLKSRRLGVQVFGSTCPDRDRFVRPHPDRVDEFGLPQLELRMCFSETELANVVASRAHFLDIMSEAGHRCTLLPVVPQLTPGSAVHYGGTVRMHRSPSYGVLNEWNRPFDVPNVVVADASCFTTNSEKNPTLTAMALASRAAHRLATDLKAE